MPFNLLILEWYIDDSTLTLLIPNELSIEQKGLLSNDCEPFLIQHRRQLASCIEELLVLIELSVFLHLNMHHQIVRPHILVGHYDPTLSGTPYCL